MAEKCRLQLEADQLQLDMAGDGDFIRTAYRALRADILKRIAPPPPIRRTVKMAAVQPLDGVGVPSEENSNDYLWVHTCNALYAKVAVAERKALSGSVAGRSLHPWRLRAIYLEEDGGPWDGLLPPTKTLWSELTPSGRRKLGRG